MPRFSPITLSILTLLNNIDELIEQSANRQEAQDVMRALRVYADNKDFDLPEEKIDNFYAILLDSRRHTISYLLQDIAADVMANDKKR